MLGYRVLKVTLKTLNRKTGHIIVLINNSLSVKYTNQVPADLRQATLGRQNYKSTVTCS